MKIWRKLRNQMRRGQFERELAEEMELHREERARRLAATGLTEQEADTAARRRFGNATALREASSDVWSWAWLDELWQNLRYALRLAGKSPGFTAVAAVTLALGIGANAAVFSIFDAVLLRPLPYRDPGKLVAIWDVIGKAKEKAPMFASYADYQQIARYAHSFSSTSAATWATGPRIWKDGERAVSVMAVPVTLSFFPTLGVKPLIGRRFDTADLQSSCAVILSDRFWKGKLRGDPGAVGKPMRIDGQSCDVVGVMSAKFTFYPRQAQMWMLAGPNFKDRDKLIVGTFARLKPGVSLQEAATEVKQLHRRLHATDGQEKDLEAAVFGLQSQFTFLAARTLKTTVWLMAGVVFCVLLIACMNVANLLIGRSFSLERELAVRAAIGSGPARLIRQLLTEALLLASVGSLGGVALSWGAVRYFNRIAPIELPVGADVRINLPVIVFSIAMTIGTTLFFGLLPAWRAARIDVNQALKAGGRGTGQQSSKQGLARVLVAMEMALSVALLIGAGWLAASLTKMSRTPLGFNARGLWVTDLSLKGSHFESDAERLRFFEALERRLPPSSALAYASSLPPYLGGNDTVEVVGSGHKPANEIGDAGSSTVSAFYFAAMRTRILRGRGFDKRDRAGTTPVAMVNRALAQEYFPHGNAVGQQIRVGNEKNAPVLTVIGIVEDQKHTELMHEMGWLATPLVYRPYRQNPKANIYVITRSGRNLAKEIGAIDSNVPVSDPEAMEERLAVTMTFARFRAVLVSAFAAIAILLACVGLHGVLAQLVSLRRAEFGIRLAIGAQARDLFLLVVKQGGGPVVVGLVAGLVAAYGMKQVLGSVLYESQASGVVVIGSAALLTAVATLAILLPARRAAQVDPATALRNE